MAKKKEKRGKTPNSQNKGKTGFWSNRSVKVMSFFGIIASVLFALFINGVLPIPFVPVNFSAKIIIKDVGGIPHLFFDGDVVSRQYLPLRLSGRFFVTYSDVEPFEGNFRMIDRNIRVFSDCHNELDFKPDAVLKVDETLFPGVNTKLSLSTALPEYLTKTDLNQGSGKFEGIMNNAYIVNIGSGGTEGVSLHLPDGLSLAVRLKLKGVVYYEFISWFFPIVTCSEEEFYTYASIDQNYFLSLPYRLNYHNCKCYSLLQCPCEQFNYDEVFPVSLDSAVKD